MANMPCWRLIAFFSHWKGNAEQRLLLRYGFKTNIATVESYDLPHQRKADAESLVLPALFASEKGIKNAV